ncbi:MAG: hypothetical protein GF334_10050 [Candidatus Altiarchaeales archaeon]|nr:hypothetical protein [Candidatus Altiarchaeales archaeon]
MNKKGQALVEMAIITPLLLIMLLGMIEVGHFMRNYMVAVNASREGARFATKARNLNIDGKTPQQIGFTDIISHTMINLGDLPDVEIAISVFQYPPTWPCDPDSRKPPENKDAWPNCHCLDPGWIPEQPIQGKYPATQPQLTYGSSEIDFTSYYNRHYKSHLQATCSLVKTSTQAVPIEEIEVVIEVFYIHKQLLGFPLFTVFVPEEVEFRVPTAMRYAESREAE